MIKSGHWLWVNSGEWEDAGPGGDRRRRKGKQEEKEDEEESEKEEGGRGREIG